MYINVFFRSRVAVSKSVEHPKYLLYFLLTDAACLFIYSFIYLGTGKHFSHSELSLAKIWAEITQAGAGLEGKDLGHRGRKVKKVVLTASL